MLVQQRSKMLPGWRVVLISLCVERHKKDVWLCALNEKFEAVRLAKFENEGQVQVFWDVFNAARLVSMEQGRLGY